MRVIHSFVAYELSLSERRKPSHTLPLDNFDGKKNSFIRHFAAYVDSLPSDRLVQKENRHFGMPHDVKKLGCTYQCKIVSGTSGILSVIGNPATGAPGYKRTPKDIEQLNFNVFFVQPPDAHIGFLLVETVAGRSVGQAFRTILINQIRARFPEITMTLARTAHTDAWKAAEEAGQSVSVKSITAIHRGIGASAMQEVGLGGVARKVGEYHRVLKFREDPQPASVLKKAREYFFPPDNSIVAEGGTISITDGDDGGPDEDEANELIAEVSYAGGSRQHVRVSGARPPLITYPIKPVGTEDTDQSFIREAKEVVKSLVEKTDCKLPPKWNDGEWEAEASIPKWEVSDFDEHAEADPVPG